MPSQTILLILLNIILSAGLSYFLYQKNIKDKSKWILSILRFLSFFIIGLILIGLTTNTLIITTQKPQLLLAVDDSESMKHIGDSAEITSTVNFLKSHKKLNDKFDLHFIKFGRDINLLDQLKFNDQQTDISNVVDYYSSDFKDNTAFILMSDGHQNLGSDYTYKLKKINSENNFALIVGDTLKYDDISIEMINVNEYAFLNNKFPVEVFVNYSGNSSVQKELILYQNKAKINSKKLTLKPNSAVSHTFYVEANKIGIQSFKAEIEALNDESNIKNNTQEFGLEVIDNRYQILIISDIIHPDLGAFKTAIESNQQNKVVLKRSNEVVSAEKYNLILFYQPQSEALPIFKNIIKSQQNYMLVLGTSTDYNLINQLNLGFLKSASGVEEDYFPSQSTDFSLYQYESLNFESYPPLKSDFSRLKISEKSENILMTKINNVVTDSPLFFILQDGQHKRSVLAAENIWKWKAKSFRNTSSFEKFNTFINQHIQFLASKETKKRLTLSVENSYNQGIPNKIKANYYDANFRFDPNADLDLELFNSDTGETYTSQMLVENNYYSSNISKLSPGKYEARLKVSDFEVKKEFQILAFNPEKTANTAATDNFKKAFDSNNLYTLNAHEKLVKKLLESENFYNIESSQTKSAQLIEIKYLLIILVLLLSIEWFFRKYLGLI